MRRALVTGVSFYVLCFLMAGSALPFQKTPIRIDDLASADDTWTRKFPSMALTNWKDMIITWSGPRDNSNQPNGIRATGITSFRLGVDMSASALQADSFVIKCTTGGHTTMYSNPFNWDGDAYVVYENAEFRTEISTYSENQTNAKNLPFQLARSYYLPPNQEFYIVEYQFTNPGKNSIDIDLMDYVISNNPSGNAQLWGWYDTDDDLYMIDETKSGVAFYFAYGVFSSNPPVSSFTVSVGNNSGSALDQFQRQSGALNNNTVYAGQEVSIGTTTTFSLASGQSKALYFFRILQPDWDSAEAVAKLVRTKTASQWIQESKQSWSDWFSQGKKPTTLTADQENFYYNSLFLMKNSQNPQLGTYVASFHPAYGFKVWARDGVFSALIMDEAGYYEEAGQYLKWMSTATLRSDGGFHTCYDWFSGAEVGFVEPQYDNDGAFLMAIYHHYVLTGDMNFVNSVYQQMQNIENFFLNNVGLYNMVFPDYSIWEESSDPTTGQPLPTAYFTFTQSMGYAGLWSASKMEEIRNNPSRSQQLLNRANQIQTAVNTHLWIQGNDGQYYYARSIWSNDSTVDTRVDSASLGAVFGGLASEDRGKNQITKVVQNLTQQTNGIGRYWGDVFFYTGIYSPGGEEVYAATPPWGVVTMFTAWSELTYGYDVSNRVEWMLEHAAPYGMAVGEAVDGVTGTFVMSSCPDLYEYAGVYIWTVLMKEGKANLPNPQTWAQ